MNVALMIAAALGALDNENRPFWIGVFLFGAFVFVTIARTGRWPPPRAPGGLRS